MTTSPKMILPTPIELADPVPNVITSSSLDEVSGAKEEFGALQSTDEEEEKKVQNKLQRTFEIQDGILENKQNTQTQEQLSIVDTNEGAHYETTNESPDDELSVNDNTSTNEDEAEIESDDENDDDDDDEEDRLINERKNEEKRRRASYWDAKVDDDHGRGKRNKSLKSYNFFKRRLQK